MINKIVNGIELRFKTSPCLFSPRDIDRGTLAMLSVAEFAEGGMILDMGCGYGVVGIYAAKMTHAENVVMADINDMAVCLSKENVVLNGLEGIRVIKSDAYENIEDRGFATILINPPYHEDFSVPKILIEKGFRKLKENGRMYIVTKRREWYKNKLLAVFGGVRISMIDGYYVFMSEKRSGK